MAQNSSAQAGEENFLRRWLGGSRRARAEIDRTLEFFDLAHKRDELAANLAFGEQRRLEFARALAAKPALVLLDEPAAGMNAEEIDQLDARIRALRKEGVTILLIEHHVELVMSVTDRIAVLNFGQKIAEGTPAASAGRSAGARGLSRHRDGGVRRPCSKYPTSSPPTARSKR